MNGNEEYQESMAEYQEALYRLDQLATRSDFTCVRIRRQIEAFNVAGQQPPLSVESELVRAKTAAILKYVIDQQNKVGH